MTMHKTLKTGSDPRTLSDYAALRDELSKLAHPARPDINWKSVEKCCLSLFEQNGVDLQTAAWYTLARTQLSGLVGLNEGLAILEALISHQWGRLWPQPVSVRQEILSSLSQRLQQRVRALPLSPHDLGQLYRAEQLLTDLSEVLRSLDHKHLSQLDSLRALIHNRAVRLEKDDSISSSGLKAQSAPLLPASAINHPAGVMGFSGGSPVEEESAQDSAVQWIYVAQAEPLPPRKVLIAGPTAAKKWKFFIAGMCSMLVMIAVAAWGCQRFYRSDPLQTQLAASPLPLSLNDTDNYLRSKYLQINRELFEEMIFTLNDIYREEMMKREYKSEDDDN